MAIAPSSKASDVSKPGARRSGRKADTGKLFMVPVAGVMLVLDLAALLGRGTPATATGALRWVNALLTCAFYALILSSYLRRGQAVATGESKIGWVVAVVATFMPLPFPLLHGAAPGLVRQLAADLLLVAGMAWAVWSLRCLGRNLSVIAQARGIADRGPYRLIRHPLYAGEIVSALGLALAAGSAAAFALWLALVAMQAYRARQEEKVLLSALPGYAAYRARTAALLPYVF
ncbi:MAG TPA: methyltransferase [Streptosporangiaceae bacterium]